MSSVFTIHGPLRRLGNPVAPVSTVSTGIAPPTPPTPVSMENTGLFYLWPAFQEESHQPDISQCLGLTNPYIQGILLRETWALLEPDADGNYEWDYLDECVEACDNANKKFAFQHLAGYRAPTAFFTLPDAKYIDLTGVGKCTVGWDPVFQDKWSALHSAMESRYGSNTGLSYICLSGVGRASESFLVNRQDPEDEAEGNALAISMGYDSLAEAWLASTKWNIDMMASTWSQPVQLTTGVPCVNGGLSAQQSAFSYGDLTYPTQFAARANDLTANGPNYGEPSQTIISSIAPHSIATGYQFGNAQISNDPSPPARLDQALNRGFSYGARLFELFAADADDPRSIPALESILSKLNL